MAVDYAKVLKAMNLPTVVIGRGAGSAEQFTEKTGLPVQSGGLDAFLTDVPQPADAAIVAVGMEALAGVTRRLLQSGVRRILIEKPGALHYSEICELAAMARDRSAQVLIGYNRRTYASTLRALEMIAQDGGVQSMNFEFTEWSHVIAGIKKAEGIKPAWVHANSSHVIDLAFHLGGMPVDMHCFTAGALEWHPSAARFAGAGVTDRNVLFSYQANWQAPGRWGVEILTANHRLIFRPMESLQVIKKGSVNVEPVVLDDHLDKAFKPGLFVQVDRFLRGQPDGLCTLLEQQAHWPLYDRIAGYGVSH
jgi:predicted dehydrogenase